MTMEPARRRRSKRLLAALSAIGTLLALEVGIRVYDAARDRSWNARASWYWMFEQDPYTGFRGRPDAEGRFGPNGTGRHNADGFRDERTLAQIDAIPGRRLVLCVGESSTYGIGVPTAAETYPARLERHLRATSGDDAWFVYNAGYPAFTSYQIVQLLQLRLLEHRPDAVVMMNLRNDVELVAKRLDDRTDYGDLPRPLAPFPKTIGSELAMRSALVGLVASRFHVAQGCDTPSDDPRFAITPRGRAFYADNLACAALLCRRAGVRLLLVDQPVFDDAHPDARRQAMRSMRATMAAECRTQGVAILEADRPMHAAGFRAPHEVHLGRKGNDLLAELLAPQILERLAGTDGR
jgi:lysophospholipase L1-like esterase